MAGSYAWPRRGASVKKVRKSAGVTLAILLALHNITSELKPPRVADV
jgi:hypothetical protein